MLLRYHAMPSLIYVRPKHVKYDQLKELVKKLPKGKGLVCNVGYTQDFKTMQMRIRSAIDKTFGRGKYRILKSSEGILIERK